MPERLLEYQTLNQKIDKGFQIQAPSWERLYIDSALAIPDQLVNLSTLEAQDRFFIKVSALSPQSLLADWLNEVWTLFEEKGFLTKRIYFNSFDGKTIEATLLGELYDPIRHRHIPHLKRLSETETQVGVLSNGETGFFARVYLPVK